jgi:hypothetical protein
LIVLQVVGKLPPLLDVVLAVHDGGYHVFDFALYSSAQLQGGVGDAIGVNPVRLPSARHTSPQECYPTLASHRLRPIPTPSHTQLDETILTWDPTSGAIVSIDAEGAQEVLAASFGAYMESFRDALLSGKLEWADGWVSAG